MVGTWHLKTDVLSSKKKSWNGTAALFWFMTWPPAELQVVMIPNNAGIHEGPITFASCHLNKPFWAPLSPSHTFSMSKSWVCLSAPVFCAQRACGTRWGGRWSCHWGRESNWRSKETRRRTEFWWVAPAAANLPPHRGNTVFLSLSLKMCSLLISAWKTAHL